MEGWNKWIGKRVFIILKSKRNYQGFVMNIDESSPPLVFITIKDKFDKEVTFVQSELELIQEENK